MANFVFTYRTAPDPSARRSRRSLAVLVRRPRGPRRRDRPAGHRQTGSVGDCGPDTTLGGYSLITAADLDVALRWPRTARAVARDGGVEVAAARRGAAPGQR